MAEKGITKPPDKIARIFTKRACSRAINPAAAETGLPGLRRSLRTAVRLRPLSQEFPKSW